MEHTSLPGPPRPGRGSCYVSDVNTSKRIFALLLAVALANGPGVSGAAPNVRETARIEALIAHVAKQSGVRFVRNGTPYDAASAADHLRMKFDAAGDRIATAAEFIDRLASRSSMSGEPYSVRLASGQDLPARVWLHAELKRIEQARSD